MANQETQEPWTLSVRQVSATDKGFIYPIFRYNFRIAIEAVAVNSLEGRIVIRRLYDDGPIICYEVNQLSRHIKRFGWPEPPLIADVFTIAEETRGEMDGKTSYREIQKVFDKIKTAWDLLIVAHQS